MVENRDNQVTKQGKKSGVFDWQDYANEGKGPGAESSSASDKTRQKLSDEVFGSRSLSRVSNEEGKNDLLGSAWSALGDGWNKSLNSVSGIEVEKKLVDNLSPELAQSFKRGKELNDSGYTTGDKKATLTKDDRKALEVYEQIDKKLVNQMPLYDQNALRKRVEEGILEKAAAVEKSKAVEAAMNALPQGAGTGPRSGQANRVVGPDMQVGAKLSPEETQAATWDKARYSKPVDAEWPGAKVKEPTLNSEDWSAVPIAKGRAAWLKNGAEQNALFAGEGSKGESGSKPETQAYSKGAGENSIAGAKQNTVLPPTAMPGPALNFGGSQLPADGGAGQADVIRNSTDKTGRSLGRAIDGNARGLSSSGVESKGSEPFVPATRRDPAQPQVETRRQQQTFASGQADALQQVDRQAGPRPAGQPGSQRAGVQERQADARVISSDTTVTPVQRIRPEGQERGGDGRQVNRPANQASDSHPAAADRAPGLNSKAAASAFADTHGRLDLDKPRLAGFPEALRTRERTGTPAAPVSDTLGCKGERPERGQQAPSRTQPAGESPPWVPAGQKGERPAGGLSRAAEVIAPQNAGKVRAAGAQVQPDGMREAFSVAGREGQEANRRVSVNGRLDVQDASRQLQADVRREGRDASRQGLAGTRQDGPDGSRQAQAGSRRDGQDAARPVDAAAGRILPQSTPPARLDVSATSGIGRVAACDTPNTFTIKDGRLPAGSLISATDKRYLTGAEIALAAVIAAAGAARVRPQATAGRAPDDSLSPAVKPPSDVLMPQRQPLAGTTVAATGAQFAPEKQFGSTQSATTGSLPSSEASIGASVHPAAAKRYITGAEIALAAVIAAAGGARVRTEPVVASPADRCAVGILPALPGESRIHNGKAVRNPEGSALRDPAGARDRYNAADCDPDWRACPSANQAQNFDDAPDHHVDTTSSADPRRNPSDISLVRQRSGLEYDALAKSAAVGGAGVGSDEPPASGAPRAPRTVLRRPTTLVSSNDTLVTIAEDFFHDANLAWLIADLNRERIKESWIDGKCVVELRNRQRLDLPVWEDIAEFYSRHDIATAPENIVTIVEECQVTRELVQSTLAPVLGSAPVSANVLLKSQVDVRPPGPPWLGR